MGSEFFIKLERFLITKILKYTYGVWHPCHLPHHYVISGVFLLGLRMHHITLSRAFSLPLFLPKAPRWPADYTRKKRT